MTVRTYRADIDALRAIAILAVLGFHAFPNFVRGGFVGVDVFFVISGYLITGILRDGLKDPHFRLRDFYARRVRRIFPALILVLACCLIVSWYVMLPNEFRQVGKHVAAGAAFASNLVLWQESGYFDAAADTKPLLHLWSLGIEEQFYAVMPVAMLVGTRFVSHKRLVTAILIGASFMVSAWLAFRDPTAAFYAPWSRVWELLAGGCLARGEIPAPMPRLARTAATLSERWFGNDIASVTGASLLLFAIVGLDKTTVFPGAWALMPVLGTMLLIHSGSSALVNRSVLRLAPLVWIGLISYPLYLWHWPILRLYLITMGELVTPQDRVVLLVVSFVAAWLTYQWVELPIRRRPATGARVISLCAAMVTLAIAGAIVGAGLIGSRNQAAGLEKILAATFDWHFPTPSLRPLLYDGNRFFQQRTSSPRVVVFIGDSNVEQLAPRISAVLDHDPSHHRSVVFATKGGCLPIPDWNPPAIRCADRLRSALEYVARPEVDAVVLGGSWINLLDDRSPLAALAPLGKLVHTLAATRKVYLVLNIPAGPRYDPRRMFLGSRLAQLSAARSAEAMPKAEFLQTYGRLRDELTRIGSANGAVIIDPLDSLCPNAECPVMSADGRPLYMDEHHMRPFHAESAATFIDAPLRLRDDVASQQK